MSTQTESRNDRAETKDVRQEIEELKKSMEVQAATQAGCPRHPGGNPRRHLVDDAGRRGWTRRRHVPCPGPDRNPLVTDKEEY